MGLINTIHIPPKVCHPKPINKYILIDYANDMREGVFDFAHYGNRVFRPSIQWADTQRGNIIFYNDKYDKVELESNLRTRKNITSKQRIALIDIMTRYWDCFCLGGTRRTILDYVFCIDTGG